jgi:glycosyltransferase involved in cell wall biosynthesis
MGTGCERISCYMVTRPVPERFELLRRSLACFTAQTYPNRALVVVLDQGPAECVARVKAELAGLPDVGVVLQPPHKQALGTLFNIALDAATGPVLCPWDDDDLNHPTRLAEQYHALCAAGAIATGLQEFFYFFRQSREMYWANFGNTADRCLGGTVMFRRGLRARYPEAGPHACKHTDSAFLHALEGEGKVRYLPGMPHLYVYVCHGANLNTEEHHRQAVQWSGLTRGLLQRRRAVFDQLACFDLGDEPIKVMGNNGPAFQIPARDLPASVMQPIPARPNNGET